MTMKQTKPERKLSLGQLAGVVVLETMNLDGKTFAWLDDDARYVSTVGRINCYEDAAREWFSEWFNVRPDHRIKIKSFKSGPSGMTFVIQVRRIPKVSA